MVAAVSASVLRTRTQVGSHHDATGDTINPLRPVEADADTLILLPAFGGRADMAGPFAGLAPVENDPNRS